MKQYKAIIFDWDGTLADSTAQVLNAITFSLKQMHINAPPIEEIQKLVGLPLTEAAKSIFPSVTPDTLQDFIAYYRQDYFKENNPAVLFEDVKLLIPKLAHKVPLTIATGKSRIGLNKALADTRIGDLFITTKTVDECYSKPNPEIVLSICDELGLLPQECIMLGDTVVDLLTAQNSGADAVAVSTGAHSVELLQSVESKAIFSNFSEFYHWISDKIVDVGYNQV